ncbi:MAG: tetratricopeptide repeat protein [Owenweeksia sp.]
MKNKARLKLQLLTILFSAWCSLLMAQSDYELGMQYYEEGAYEKAVDYLSPALRRSPNAKAYEAVINSYLALEEYNEAEDLTEYFLRKGLLNAMDLYTDLVYINILSKDTREADKAMEEMKKRVQANPSLAYGAGNALQKKGYPKLALEIYELAETRNPGMQFDYQKALLYGELGDLQNMYRMYVEMVMRSPSYLPSVKNLIAQGITEGEEDENIQFLKEQIITKIQEGGPRTMNDLLVFVYIQEKNFRGAFTQLKALDRRAGGNRAEVYNLGRVALNNGEFELALKIFDYVLDAGKDNPFYEEARVQKLVAQRKLLESKDDTEIAAWRDLQKQYYRAEIELKGLPEIGALRIDLAHLTAFRMDETDSAVAILERTIGTSYVSDEDKARAKIELGDILLYTGERWDAILYYGQAEKAFEKSPIGQEAKFKRAKAAYYVGDFQWAQGIFNALKASTSKLIANDAMRYSLLINDNIALDTTTDAMKLFARADLLNFQGKKDSAMIILNTLQKAFPGHSIQDEVLLLRSEIWMSNKNYEEAAIDLQAIIDQYPDDILADDAQFRLAELLETRMNRTEEAKVLYRNLFTEHPDSFFTAEARKRFRLLRGDFLN